MELVEQDEPGIFSFLAQMTVFAVLILAVHFILLKTPPQPDIIQNNGWKVEVQSKLRTDGQTYRIIEVTGEGTRYDFLQVGSASPMIFQTEPQDFPHDTTPVK